MPNGPPASLDAHGSTSPSQTMSTRRLPLAHRLSRERRRHDSDHTVVALVREKAQSSKVDSQNRDTRSADDSRRAQDRSVPAEDDRQIDAAGKLL